jgi:hypothetical protein
MLLTIVSISSYPIVPSPSMSYNWKAHLSFSSNRPLLVTLNAQMNSEKSMVPLLFSSKTLKTKSANVDGSPKLQSKRRIREDLLASSRRMTYGKNDLYIRANSALSSTPDGQSLMKPLYHCCSSFLSTVKYIRGELLHRLKHPTAIDTHSMCSFADRTAARASICWPCYPCW